jgi:hypothetical protein
MVAYLICAPIGSLLAIEISPLSIGPLSERDDLAAFLGPELSGGLKVKDLDIC